MMTNMGGTTMFGMGIGWILIVVVSVIIIAALLMYLRRK